MNGYIYGITWKNSTIIRYVGQSCRIAKYDTHYPGGGALLWRYYNKYGLDAFSKKILHENLTSKESLNQWEIFYISWYSTFIDLGYGGWNLTRGGDGQSVETLSRYSRDIMSEKAVKRCSTPSGRKIMANRARTQYMEGKNPNWTRQGRINSLEHNQKISRALTGKKKSETHRKNISEGVKRQHARQKAEKQRLNTA